MMADATTEADMLDSVVSELQEEGYEVFLQPRRPPAPAFLGNYVPDAIAMRDNKNLVVEVLRKSSHASQRIERLRSLLHGQEHWDLRVYWVSPTTSQRSLAIVPGEAIAASNTDVRSTAEAGFVEPALLLAWGTLEAAARANLPERFQRPQSPRRLIEILASEGYITPSQADQMRSLADKRNRLIHGELGVNVTAEEVKDFAEVLDALIEQIVPQSNH